MKTGPTFRYALATIALVASLVSANSASLADSTAQQKLQSSLKLLMANYNLVQKRMGAEQAENLQERLNTELGLTLSGDAPAGFPQADWSVRLEGVVDLDSSLLEQVIRGKSNSIEGSRGLVERLISARSDRTLQPFALYVPMSLPPDPTLVILLHGRNQDEAEILAEPYFRTLADSTGTIIAAPYGRGIYDFAPPADDEVYQVAEEVAAAFHISAHRTYLVGYSMGGFSVFKVGPEHPDQWVAIMCISGALLNSEAETVRTAYAGKPIYVITGELDQDIPTTYPQGSAMYLHGVGMTIGLYVQPRGTHVIPTFLPALTDAWHDMMGGHVRLSAVPRSGTGLPNAPPPPMTMGGRP